MPSTRRRQRQGSASIAVATGYGDDTGQTSPRQEESRAGREVSRDAQDDDEDAPQRIDLIAALKRAQEPQPLDIILSDAALKTQASAWTDLLTNVVSTGELLIEVSAFAAEHLDGDQDMSALGMSEHTEPQEALMRQIADSTLEVQIRKQALAALREKLNAGQPIYDAPTQYTETVEAALAARNAKTTRQRYGDSSNYKAFRTRIWNSLSDDPMPPLNDLLPAEEGDGDGDEDEVLIGGSRTDYRCPISMCTMTDPLSSTVCSHSYERKAIIAYLEQHRDHVTCPINGCRAILRKSNLKEDPALRREAQAYTRRQERKRLQAQAGSSSIVD